MDTFILTELIILCLSLVGLCFNGLAMVHVARSFDLKTHVYSLIFVDALTCTACCAATVIFDGLILLSVMGTNAFTCNLVACFEAKAISGYTR